MIKPAERQEPIKLLKLTGSTAAGYEWSEEDGCMWSQAAPGNGKNYYSSVGLGAKSAEFVVRAGSFTLDNAIEWRGRHCLITDIEPADARGIFERVSAAVVDIVACMANPMDNAQRYSFPGVITEKYMRHEQQEPMAVNIITYVLITPKAIALNPGDLVKVSGTNYEIQLAHTLDGHKNEYEIKRTVDL